MSIEYFTVSPDNFDDGSSSDESSDSDSSDEEGDIPSLPTTTTFGFVAKDPSNQNPGPNTYPSPYIRETGLYFTLNPDGTLSFAHHQTVCPHPAQKIRVSMKPNSIQQPQLNSVP